MSPRRRLLFLVVAALASASVASHWVGRISGLRAQPLDPMRFPAGPGARPALAAGSSLAYYGVDWSLVATGLNLDLTVLVVPNGSAREVEVLQRSAPKAAVTFLCISAADMNENYLSDYRADLVPFREEAHDLWSTHASRAHAIRVLSQYPMKYLRLLFPTAGRSQAVLVWLREAGRRWMGRREGGSASDHAVLTVHGDGHTENIGTLPAARLRRVLADVASRTGEFHFHSTKQVSLVRALRRAASQGRVVVVVVPESSAYRAEFLGSDVRRRFEDSLAQVRAQVPEAKWLRLDQVPELNTNGLYWDLFHMNTAGQALATRNLLAELRLLGIP